MEMHVVVVVTSVKNIDMEERWQMDRMHVLMWLEWWECKRKMKQSMLWKMLSDKSACRKVVMIEDDDPGTSVRRQCWSVRGC